MSFLGYLGAAPLSGAGYQLTNYWLRQITFGDADVKLEEVHDDAGKLASRLELDRWEKVTLELDCKAAATPVADFPKNRMCAWGETSPTGITFPIAGAVVWANLEVEDVKFGKKAGINTVSVTLRYLGSSIH